LRTPPATSYAVDITLTIRFVPRRSQMIDELTDGDGSNR